MIDITIGIPAYNSEKNIANLLQILLQQKMEGFLLKEILVYVDGVTDQTTKQAKSLKDKRIRVIAAKKNNGIAYGLAYIVKHKKAKNLVLLNDDIIIADKLFLKKLLAPLTSQTNIGLLSGNPQPLPGHTFIENAAISTFRAYERMRYAINNGHNKWTCDGKVLVLSEAFCKKFVFPKKLTQMGNVDSYLYFFCVTNQLAYYHVKSAKVFFKMPSTIADYARWNTRNNTNFYIHQKDFGKVVSDEYAIPLGIIVKSYLREFIHNPLGCLVIKIIGMCNQFIASRTYQTFNPKWTIVKTTKI